MDFQSKTFLLGIGAQKAGTSWLRAYLSARDDIYVPPREMHFFDVRYGPNKQKRQDRLTQKMQAAKNGKINRLLKLKLESLESDNAYAQFFEDRTADDVNVFGDITPSYYLISEEGFRGVRRLFSNTKVVFVMRDPVDRLYSQIRMTQRRGNETDSVASVMNPGFVRGSRYDLTITTLEKVFAPSDILYLFYENLFCPETIKLLCRFVGLPYLEPNFDQAVNSGGKRTAVPPWVATFAFRQLGGTYRFCREKFGSLLPPEWGAHDRI